MITVYSILQLEEDRTLKITVEHIKEGENEIILKCKKLDEEMLEILELLKERSFKIPAKTDEGIYMAEPNEIYYIETIEGKTFIYTKDVVIKVNFSLIELETKYMSFGFTRINKSQIVNIYYIKSLKALINSKIKLTLKSDEQLILSRHYNFRLKENLGILKGEN
ncbi:LytTr DNA-binding domain protein [Anaerofustis stercorihominis DSM 17244]|uniref:LytTr DNA-binding domain protein n=1 Tax=Anaerofustis stercorihominis DSM 17244 TaxID=445971 RepID=B1CA90_9FIRM|nr:LytTr DNA-binding domain protein [Anaerofustis stercorihominis DSM 17244]